MPTREQLESALVNADRAGDVQAASALANALKQMKVNQPKPEKKTSDGYGLNLAREGLQGMTFGLSDEIGAGLAAAAASVSEGVSWRDAYKDIIGAVRGEQNAFREENPGAALGAQVAGGIATGMPAKLLAGVGTFAKGAISGGVPGAVAGYGFSESDNAVDQARDTVIGGMSGAFLGVALPKVAEKAAQTWRRLAAKGGVTLTDEAGRVTNEAINKLDEAIKSGAIKADEAGKLAETLAEKGVLTPEQLKKAQLFERRGVTPLRANLTESVDDYRQLNEGLKRSGEVSKAVAEQDRQLAGAVNAGIDKIAPSSSNVIETNSSIFRAVDDTVKALDDRVSQSYAAARDLAKGEKVVRFSNLEKALRENAGLENASGGVVSALRGELKNRGVIIKGWKAEGLTDVDTAEQVRQFLNSLHDPMKPRGNMLLRDLKEALDADVMQSFGDDVFKDARAAKVEMQRIIERGKRNKFDTTGNSLLERIIRNEIPEEKISQSILSARDDDFIKVKGFLLEHAGDAGKQSFKDLKAQTIRDALESAIKTQGKGEEGQAVFNSNLFARKFEGLRKTKKWTELFDQDERELIDDIIAIGKLRVPQRLVASGEGPSAYAINQLKGQVFKHIPLIGDKIDDLSKSVQGIRQDARQLYPMRETEKVLKEVKK